MAETINSDVAASVVDLMIRHAPPPSFVEYVLANPVIIAGAFAGLVTIIVGLITYNGVRVTVAAAETRMRKELEHDAKRAAEDREESRLKSVTDRTHSAFEAQRERLATARRAVYLEAAKQLTLANGYLGRLATVDFDNPGPTDNLVGLQSSVSQVTVISEHATALKARALSACYTQIFMQALPRVLPIGALRAKAAVFKEYFNIAMDERKRIAKAMAAFNEAPIKDHAQWELLKMSASGQEQLANKHEENRRTAEKEMAQLRLEYAAWVFGEVENLTKPLDDLACSIRAELGLESDVVAFHAQSEKLQDLMRDIIKDSMGKIMNPNRQNTAAESA